MCLCSQLTQVVENARPVAGAGPDFLDGHRRPRLHRDGNIARSAESQANNFLVQIWGRHTIRSKLRVSEVRRSPWLVSAIREGIWAKNCLRLPPWGGANAGSQFLNPLILFDSWLSVRF